MYKNTLAIPLLPRSPLVPLAPVAPISPLSPCSPFCPLFPCHPTSPLGPYFNNKIIVSFYLYKVRKCLVFLSVICAIICVCFTYLGSHVTLYPLYSHVSLLAFNTRGSLPSDWSLIPLVSFRTSTSLFTY